MIHAPWLLACLCVAAFAVSGGPPERVAQPLSSTDAPAGGCLVLPVVCVIQIRGEANEAFDSEGLQAALNEAESLSPDVIVVDVDTTWDLYRGNDQSVYTVADCKASMEEVDTATDAARTLCLHALEASERKKPVRVVAWIGRAVGPSAVFGFCCPETYYRSTTVHGGIASARQIDRPRSEGRSWWGTGSLRWARMRGIAVRVGYPERVVQAMQYDWTVLSYSIRTSGILFFEDSSGDTRLTDGGGNDDEATGRRDTLADSLAFTGNDMLVLRGEQGVKLGLAKACADDVGQLIEAMGVPGCPTVVTIPVKHLGTSAEPPKK